MTSSPPFIPPAELAQLLNLMRHQHAATLTAAIVSAAGRPFSIAEVQEIQRDIFWAENPDTAYEAYRQWAETKDERLAKICS